MEPQVEAELVAEYVAWVDHAVVRERRFGSRYVDIFDAQQREIVEGKAYADDVVALGAVKQAALYRTLANRGLDRDIVDRVAVLLAEAPSDDAREVARVYDLGADVIWPDGDGFRREPFE